MTHLIKKRTLVPCLPAIPDQVGGHGKGGARGAKSPRATKGRQHQLTLATYHGRTLRLDEHLAQLEVELANVRWHILVLCEIQGQGEDTVTLESGHFIYNREGNRLPIKEEVLSWFRSVVFILLAL